MEGHVLNAAFADASVAVKREPALTVSEWADDRRVLPPEENEPGPWRTSRTPYLREIMDCLSPTRPEEVVVLMKANQVGATEAGSNWIGYVMEHAPARMLVAWPTVEDAKANSEARIDPLIEWTPGLSERVATLKSGRGDRVLSKRFPGGILKMTGANSARGLRSLPARYLFLDEVDAYPADVDGEGDPVKLAIKRTDTFKGRRKIFITSTPTTKGYSRIARLFEASDQRFFFVPCPRCGHFQRLSWSRADGVGWIHWPKGRRDRAAMLCAGCGKDAPHHLKGEMMLSGEWRATNPGPDRAAGFHLSGLYSPWVSWTEGAQMQAEAGRDPELVKVWVNLYLAETYDPWKAEEFDPEGLMARREDWGEGVPPEVGVVTAGVDVQDDRLEIEVVGWGRDEESWSLDYRAIRGDPSAAKVWADLDEHLKDQPWQVDATCVDTGGHHTLAAYAYCKGRENRRVWAIKGADGRRLIWPRRPSRSNKGRVNLFIVGVDAAKEAIYARLRGVTEPGPGFMHFPMDRDREYFEQLTAETMKTKYVRGFPVPFWLKSEHRRNEALDCRVYAYAALHGLIAMGLRLNRRVAQLRARRDAAISGNAPQRPARETIRSTYMDR